MLTSFIGALIVSSVIVSSVASSQDTEIYEVTEAIYDDDGDMYYDDSYYPNDWRELYDNSMNSDVETQMLLDIGNQSQSLLIDNNDNVYYSGYEVVSTYIEAQYQMRDELNCMELYQEYVFLQNDDSNFIEVYSYDFSNWVIINKDMLQVYLEQDLNDDYIIDCDVPSYEDCDILSLSTSAQAYDDYNNAPFVYAFRLNKQSKAKVSRDIIDLCLEAMQERMYSLPMAYYVPMYEEYNHQYELVSCSKLDTPNGRDITFVPKDFIMVNVSDLEENQELEASENIEENENFEESIIEDNHHNEIHEEDYGDVIEETYFN